MSEVAHQAGTNGLWIDQLTTLDPHPLNNDGFFDAVVGDDAPSEATRTSSFTTIITRPMNTPKESLSPVPTSAT
jgi:hypothetical protein